MNNNARQWPEEFVASRVTLQRVAVHVLARRRAAQSGRFGLRATPGGFGTPVFGNDEVLRVSGATLVRECRIDDRLEMTTTSIDGNTLRGLAMVVDVDLDPQFSVGRDTVPLADVDEPLRVAADASVAIGDWYSFGVRALDRAVVAGGGDATVAQLWPEHFDVGLDVAWPGNSDGARVNLGASAGDGYIAEPYLYLGPRSTDRPGDPDYWNAPFGAAVSFSEVTSDIDADAFFARGLQLLRDA